MHKFRPMAQVFSYYYLFLFTNNAASLKSEIFTPCCSKYSCLKPVFFLFLTFISYFNSKDELLKFSYIHQIGWDDWREQQRNLNSRPQVLQKNQEYFFLMFLLPKSDSHFLKFICFLEKKSQEVFLFLT